MFGSEILEVAIGLVVVFLLFSLILTAAREAIEAWLRSRARDLERSLTELLGKDNLRAFYAHPLIFALYRGAAPGSGKIGRRGPSYIPARNFALAVADLVESGAKLPAGSPAHQAFATVMAATKGNLDAARVELEAWYDSAMERASGWYRRRTQEILLWLGLALAVVLNVNAFGIARHLAADDELRRQVVALAEAEAGPDAPEAARANAITAALYERGLPIGWNDARWAAMAGDGSAALERADRAAILRLVELLLGYVAVALAGMLGAPFWFDVLNKVMVIRFTVKPHEKSPEEASEDRQVRPKVS